MCLINLFKNVFIKQLLFFFHLLPLSFEKLQLLFPAIVTSLSFFLITRSVFDVVLLAYPSRTNLTKDSAAEVEKLHIKSIKDIKSIIVRLLVQT